MYDASWICFGWMGVRLERKYICDWNAFDKQRTFKKECLICSDNIEEPTRVANGICKKWMH